MKGVSKRVVEIHNPDSLYFDKAIFYLKPNLHELSPALLRADAHVCIRTYSPQAGQTFRKLRRLLRVTGLLLLAGLLAAAGYFLGAK